MLYEICDGTVSCGGRQILSHIHFEIKGNEKIGIVGRNGSGKTTLLRTILGELSPDRDDKRQGPAIRTSRSVVIRMLRQTQEADFDRSVEELLFEGADPEERNRPDFSLRFDRMMTGLGFTLEDKKKRLRDFSGGEQTKLQLLRHLLEKPDILLLDEPTNHLDVSTVEWLERYLKSYGKACVFVSHDRYFLDETVSVIYELRDGRLIRYAGNYTFYREEHAKALQKARAAYQRQQKEVERLDGLITKFRNKPRKASFVRSRKTILERMERLEKPFEDEARIFTGEILPEIRPNKWILEAKELGIGYDRELLNLSLRIRSGQKIGIIGDNGTGKTAFLRIIAGLLPPLKGECILGEKTTIGYFDQQTAMLESELSVIEHFHRLFPGMTEKEARQTLAGWLFPGRTAQTRVSSLSGGEKARLVLAEILTARPNLLILDEPTNHMDIPAKETVESFFRAYRGTILFVSHDRYFIRQVASEILVFDQDRAMYYPFGYEHYRQRAAKQGESLSALVRAEDQALISGFRAVPEKEKHMLREIGTEEVYRDWKLGLLQEEMERLERRWKELSERLREEQEQDLLTFAESGDAEPVPTENASTDREFSSGEDARAAEKAACEAYTEACIEWWSELTYYKKTLDKTDDHGIIMENPENISNK